MKRIGPLAALLAAVLSAALLPATADARQPEAARTATASSANPLDDHPWPIYRGHAEGAYAAWVSALGTTKTLLGKIAAQPRVIWLTDGDNPGTIREITRKRIADFHQTNPGGYAQLAVFGLYPDGENRRREPFTVAMRDRYRAWVREIAAGIGSHKVIMVLEPDLAVALTGWGPNVRFALAKYAAQVFSRLPNTIVYVDGSDADWLPVDKAIAMLLKAGVQYTHGIALGSTHYAGAAPNILYGGKLVSRLSARGIKNKKFIIDTADNGVPYTHKQYYATHPGGTFDNPNVCRTKTETLCQTLGIPPTTDVANVRWKMSAGVRSVAAKFCDAFLWYGRPWIYKQASPFQLTRALQLARTTKWQ